MATQLTTENAPMVATIICREHPEWGTKRFNYRDQPLCNGRFASSHGVGCNASVLFEEEYRFWDVVTWKK
jgi:hypothetical protein